MDDKNLAVLLEENRLMNEALELMAIALYKSFLTEVIAKEDALKACKVLADFRSDSGIGERNKNRPARLRELDKKCAEAFRAHAEDNQPIEIYHQACAERRAVEAD